MTDDRARDYPHSAAELDARHLLYLDGVDVGDSVWVPVSPVRGDKFRAMKIRIEERVSVNNYEEHHAIDKWPESDRAPIPHQHSEGINCCMCGDNDDY